MNLQETHGPKRADITDPSLNGTGTFGRSLSLGNDGNYIIVESPAYQSSSGRVNVYRFVNGSWISISSVGFASSGEQVGWDVDFEADGGYFAFQEKDTMRVVQLLLMVRLN